MGATLAGRRVQRPTIWREKYTSWLYGYNQAKAMYLGRTDIMLNNIFRGVLKRNGYFRVRLTVGVDLNVY